MLYNLTGLPLETVQFIANCVGEKPFAQVENIIVMLRTQVAEQDKAEAERQAEEKARIDAHQPKDDRGLLVIGEAKAAADAAAEKAANDTVDELTKAKAFLDSAEGKGLAYSRHDLRMSMRGEGISEATIDALVPVISPPPNAEGGERPGPFVSMPEAAGCGEQARTTLQQFKEALDPNAQAVPTPLIRDLPQPDPAPEGSR